MRLTYTDLKNEYARRIGATEALDSDQTNAFNLSLGTRYQTTLAILSRYVTSEEFTAATVADQQYYFYPPGIVQVESVTITIGSVKYPLSFINSQHNWDILNAITIQASAVPQFIFPRRDDYGIWPIPQDAYTITFNYHWRDRNLLVADYTTGTVTVTNNSATVTGSGTTWTSAMIGRWFEITDTSNQNHGYWYRVSAVASTTSLTLERAWVGSTASTVTYRIGETPEIPEEGHISLCDGATADFYSGQRDGNETGIVWENRFWTGDGNNASRQVGDDRIVAGILGLVNRYNNRGATRIVNRRPKLSPLPYKVFATTLSS